MKPKYSQSHLALKKLLRAAEGLNHPFDRRFFDGNICNGHDPHELFEKGAGGDALPWEI